MVVCKVFATMLQMTAHGIEVATPAKLQSWSPQIHSQTIFFKILEEDQIFSIGCVEFTFEGNILFMVPYQIGWEPNFYAVVKTSASYEVKIFLLSILDF